MPSAANYNMRALLIIVLISAAFADDAAHFPTNHPGVCNILAFVSDHVDEVVHVAHDEIEAVTDKSSNSSTALSDAIERVKRHASDLKQMAAQCLATDLKKVDTVKKPQQIPLATSEVTQLKTNPQEVHTSHKQQSENVGNLQEIKEKASGNKTPSADETQQVSQQLSQHIAAGTEDVKRLVTNVMHLLQNISGIAPQTDKDLKQKDTIDANSQLPAADVVQQSPEHVATSETKLRQVRDVANLLGSLLETADGTQHNAIPKNAGNVGELLLPTYEQRVATQGRRRRRNAVTSIEEEITNVSKKLHTKTADVLQQDLKRDSLQRIARDVAHILDTQSIRTPSHLENEVNEENNLQNLKPDYFQTVDILPQETQYVAVQESLAYADQLFPPTIGQQADFQERLKRNVVDQIPTQSQHVASSETAPRFVRDVVHLLDTSTTLAPKQDKQTSAVPQTTDVLPQDTQHVAKQQTKETVKDNVAAATVGNEKHGTTADIPQTVPIPTHEVTHKVLQHVAAKKTDVKVAETNVLTNRRKRNVEIGRKSPDSTLKQQNNVWKNKSKRSSEELQVSSDQTSQPEHSVDYQAAALTDNQENKYIQIVKRRSFDKRTRRSDNGQLIDQTKTTDFVRNVEDSHDMSVIEIVPPARVVRSLTDSIKTPEQYPIQNTVVDENSQHAANRDVHNKRVVSSTDDSSNVPSSISTQNPIDSKDDVREFLKPTVKVQHFGLPLTQFARRNTFKKAR